MFPIPTPFGPMRLPLGRTGGAPSPTSSSPVATPGAGVQAASQHLRAAHTQAQHPPAPAATDTPLRSRRSASISVSDSPALTEADFRTPFTSPSAASSAATPGRVGPTDDRKSAPPSDSKRAQLGLDWDDAGPTPAGPSVSEIIARHDRLPRTFSQALGQQGTVSGYFKALMNKARDRIHGRATSFPELIERQHAQALDQIFRSKAATTSQDQLYFVMAAHSLLSPRHDARTRRAIASQMLDAGFTRPTSPLAVNISGVQRIRLEGALNSLAAGRNDPVALTQVRAAIGELSHVTNAIFSAAMAEQR